MMPRTRAALVAILTVALGALPATLLGIVAVTGLLMGGAAVVTERDFPAVLLSVWSLAGILGAYGLWRAALGISGAQTKACLAVGVLALAAVCHALWSREAGFPSVDMVELWLLVSPILVATYHLTVGDARDAR